MGRFLEASSPSASWKATTFWLCARGPNCLSTSLPPYVMASRAMAAAQNTSPSTRVVVPPRPMSTIPTNSTAITTPAGRVPSDDTENSCTCGSSPWDEKMPARDWAQSSSSWLLAGAMPTSVLR